jgi:hypothetical protein
MPQYVRYKRFYSMPQYILYSLNGHGKWKGIKRRLKVKIPDTQNARARCMIDWMNVTMEPEMKVKSIEKPWNAIILVI